MALYDLGMDSNILSMIPYSSSNALSPTNSVWSTETPSKTLKRPLIALVNRLRAPVVGARLRSWRRCRETCCENSLRHSSAHRADSATLEANMDDSHQLLTGLQIILRTFCDQTRKRNTAAIVKRKRTKYCCIWFAEWTKMPFFASVWPAQWIGLYKQTVWSPAETKKSVC